MGILHEDIASEYNTCDEVECLLQSLYCNPSTTGFKSRPRLLMIMGRGKGDASGGVPSSDSKRADPPSTIIGR